MSFFGGGSPATPVTPATPASAPRAAEATAAPARPRKHIAFSASAGCFPYQCGIAQFIAANFDLSGVTFSGSSGGAWPAILLASERDVEWAMELLVTLGPPVLSPSVLGAYCQYHKSARHVFEQIFRGIALRDRVRRRLYISVTRVCWCAPFPYFKNEIVSSFFSNQDVFEGMLASCLIPFAVNGRPYVEYRGWVCVDSAITNVTGTISNLTEVLAEKELEAHTPSSSSSSSASSAGLKGESKGAALLGPGGGCRAVWADIMSAIDKARARPVVLLPCLARLTDAEQASSKAKSASRGQEEEEGGEARERREESRPFGLLSLGVRTSKSLLALLAAEIASAVSGSGSGSDSALACSKEGEGEAAAEGESKGSSGAADGDCWFTCGSGVDLVASTSSSPSSLADADCKPKLQFTSHSPSCEEKKTDGSGSGSSKGSGKGSALFGRGWFDSTASGSKAGLFIPINSAATTTTTTTTTTAAAAATASSSSPRAPSFYWQDKLRGSPLLDPTALSNIKSAPSPTSSSSSLSAAASSGAAAHDDCAPLPSAASVQVLEVTPWMYRPLPLSHYHLSSDPAVLWDLYEQGKRDAEAHAAELYAFFLG